MVEIMQASEKKNKNRNAIGHCDINDFFSHSCAEILGLPFYAFDFEIILCRTVAKATSTIRPFLPFFFPFVCR